MVEREKQETEDCPKSDAGQYVTRDLCDERTTRVFEKISDMDKSLSNKLKGIDQKVGDIIAASNDEKKEKRKANRSALIAILSGAVISLLAWGLAHIHF